MHPKLLAFVKELLNCNNIRLIQSDIWAKTGETLSSLKKTKNSNNDQRIHMDYPNNYLTHPDTWYNPESVAIIIYYSNSLQVLSLVVIFVKLKYDLSFFLRILDNFLLLNLFFAY